MGNLMGLHGREPPSSCRHQWARHTARVAGMNHIPCATTPMTRVAFVAAARADSLDDDERKDDPRPMDPGREDAARVADNVPVTVRMFVDNGFGVIGPPPFPQPTNFTLPSRAVRDELIGTLVDVTRLGGLDGIIVPHDRTAEQVKKLVTGLALRPATHGGETVYPWQMKTRTEELVWLITYGTRGAADRIHAIATSIVTARDTIPWIEAWDKRQSLRELRAAALVFVKRIVQLYGNGSHEVTRSGPVEVMAPGTRAAWFSSEIERALQTAAFLQALDRTGLSNKEIARAFSAMPADFGAPDAWGQLWRHVYRRKYRRNLLDIAEAIMWTVADGERVPRPDAPYLSVDWSAIIGDNKSLGADDLVDAWPERDFTTRVNIWPLLTDRILERTNHSVPFEIITRWEELERRHPIRFDATPDHGWPKELAHRLIRADAHRGKRKYARVVLTEATRLVEERLDTKKGVLWQEMTADIKQAHLDIAEDDEQRRQELAQLRARRPHTRKVRHADGR